MKWSAADVVEVPPGPTTVMSTVPADPAGAVTWSDVSEIAVNVLATTVPNFTCEAPVKWVPITTTAVPPTVLPLEGLTLVTVGADAEV